MSNKVTLNGQELFPSRYFTAQDLPTSKAFVVEIRAIHNEEMTDPRTKKPVSKPVIYFVKPRKGAVLGDEFAESIAVALGEWQAEKWIGQKVIIERLIVRTDRNGIKEGIRARAVTSNGLGVATAIPAIADDDEDDDNA
jgi:hypothetical protein